MNINELKKKIFNFTENPTFKDFYKLSESLQQLIIKKIELTKNKSVKLQSFYNLYINNTIENGHRLKKKDIQLLRNVGYNEGAIANLKSSIANELVRLPTSLFSIQSFAFFLDKIAFSKFEF